MPVRERARGVPGLVGPVIAAMRYEPTVSFGGFLAVRGEVSEGIGAVALTRTRCDAIQGPQLDVRRMAVLLLKHPGVGGSSVEGFGTIPGLGGVAGGGTVGLRQEFTYRAAARRVHLYALCPIAVVRRVRRFELSDRDDGQPLHVDGRIR